MKIPLIEERFTQIIPPPVEPVFRHQDMLWLIFKNMHPKLAKIVERFPDRWKGED